MAQQPVLVLMGVAGTGKSTVAAVLAGQLGWDFQEGDDLHPAANVQKMHAGIPLTDADRAPWLATVRAWIDEHVRAGLPGIITCSALRHAYRDELRGDHVVFVYLTGSPELIRHRLAARQGHYMPASLLDSQFATLEPPGPDESAVTVDVGEPPARQAAGIVQALDLRPEAGSTALGIDLPGVSRTPAAPTPVALLTRAGRAEPGGPGGAAGYRGASGPGSEPAAPTPPGVQE